MATLKTRKEVETEARELFGRVPSWTKDIPEVALGGFWDLLVNFQLAETAIPGKYKELIGLAVSGATRCKYCALFHTEVARLAGATDEEIAEASMMGGFTMMASTYINAQQVDYDEFAKETREIVSYVRAHMPPPSTEAAATARH